MIRILVFLALVSTLVSCGIAEQAKHYASLSDRLIGCPWPEEIAEAAFETFEIEYLNRFVDPNDWFSAYIVSDSLDRIIIECQETFEFEIDWYGEKYVVTGITDNYDYARVGAPLDLELGQTSLFHELIHVILWNLFDEPDPDHEKSQYVGWTENHTLLESDLQLMFQGYSP